MTEHHDRHNDIMSGVLHAIGVGLAIAALVLMIIFAAKFGSPKKIVTVSLFGGGMILLYLASSLYHLIPPEKVRLKAWLRKLDYAMIFILIAATYTPITLVGLQGGWGWSIFGIIWGIALLGVILKFTTQHLPAWIYAVQFVVMGWFVLIAIVPLIHTLSTQALFWLILGGVMYTTGALLYALDKALPKVKIFGTHEWFHLFVIGGSFSHFWMVLHFL